MWTLESTGDLFGGRQIWLRPGTKHLFGRTKPPQGEGSPIERNHYIDNKSVSRKHIVIEVQTVHPGAATSLRSRSKITVTDTSKVGTKVDEDKFSGSSRELSNHEHRIQLGLYDQAFIVKWQPVVITFISYPKSLKNNPDPFKIMQERLEPLDIKITREYVVGSTTHIVSNKRNIATGLQALINGSYIVTDSFVDAVMEAAQAPADASDPDSDFLLDNDFSNMPNPMKYMPPAGKEPIPRPPEYFKPNPARADIFSGYTFIFSNSTQFKSLGEVVNTGGGKAFEFELKPQVSTVQDFITYVANIAGEKGLSSIRNFKSGKGIVIVRNKDNDSWTSSWQRQVEAELKQEALNQNALLEIILTINPSVLRKPLTAGIEVPSSFPAPPSSTQPSQRYISQPSAQSSRQTQVESESVEMKTESQPRRRPPRKLVTQSRFTGFDDYKPEPRSMVPEPEEDSLIPDSVPDADVESEAQSVDHMEIQPVGTRSRKRKASPVEGDKGDLVDELLSGTAAMKRRRLAQGVEGGAKSRTRAQSISREESSGRTSLFKKKKKDVEIDVLESARERREAEEEVGRLDAEALHSAMEGMDIEAIRSLVQVEEMLIQPRANKPAPASGDRWDDRWDGRRNFKKFRKVGGQAPMRGSKIIVPLEEVKRKEYGMGQDYFFEENSGARPPIPAGSTFERTQDSLPTGQQQSKHPAASPRDGSEAPRNAATVDLTFEDDYQDTMEVPESPQTVASETQRSKRSTKGTQTSTTQASTSKAAKKRPAEAEPPRPPPMKKARAVARARSPDESEGEDDLRFKFRKRR
ncbi:hypothetical protein P152DRAFT_456399 [Eremomyces bilateralis CBS 781.70]|uniref:FHA domain-containing protein n=1 Tax=Eremomyces bilateralis CBS 781.70 TaxID=1392243 RepID=A0A6G1G7W5_9PEZI|nr:uncharacterized protein P152DRAFT_456399 [Eremomyces bilateralis CBS 781.70]KAF1814167.1 hypothetical protein P152DRAFT_456399 [Eremomyces bilateralis CBS 781.70]